jgi:uncharacterized protein (DUF1697 family)
VPVFIALLRAVNVGGTGKLPMDDLKRLCEKAGFRKVRTYIASGNVAAERTGSEAEAKAVLEGELRGYAGKPVGVIVRTAAEMSEIVANNPFPDRAANRTVAILLDAAPAADALTRVTGQANEELRLGGREIYVHYPDGIGRSKLSHSSRPHWNRPQHEHRRQARDHGGEMRSPARSRAPGRRYRQAHRAQRPQADFRSGFAFLGEASASETPLAFTSAA